MKEACLGTTKRVRMMLESTCPDCNGTGAKKGSGSTVSLLTTSITAARFRLNLLYLQFTLPLILGHYFIFRNVITVEVLVWKQKFKVHL